MARLLQNLTFMTSQRMRRTLSWIRWLPFTTLAATSIWAAGRAPRGRKSFEFDLRLSTHALARAMTKGLHLKYIALSGLLALVAVGLRRWKLAWAMAMGVGLSWELAETTVFGQNARLVDLAPDLVSATAVAVISRAVGALLRPAAKRSELE